MKVHEHHHRTLFKSISWLLVGFLVTFGVLLLFTGNAAAAALDAVIIQIIKFLFFYIHERAWNNISYGQEIKNGRTHSIM